MTRKHAHPHPKDEAFSCYLSIETEAMTMRGLLAGAEALIENDQDRNHVQVLVSLAQDTAEEIWKLTQRMHHLHQEALKSEEKPPVSA